MDTFLSMSIVYHCFGGLTRYLGLIEWIGCLHLRLKLEMLSKIR